MNFQCETPACGRSDIVDRLFNINVREAGKPQRRVVICERCAREARRVGHTAYSYSETLKRDAAQAAGRNGRSQFFNDLLKVVAGKKPTDPSSISKVPAMAPQAT